MKIEVIRDVTLTVKAGQIVEVFDQDAPNLIRLGYAKKVADHAPAEKKQVKRSRKKKAD